MKKILIAMLIACVIIPATSNAQLQKGNILVGGDIANLNFTLGGGGFFQGTLDPKLAWFIRDNLALGGMLNFGIATGSGAGTSTSYGVGALGRYYFSNPDLQLLKHGRFFAEGNVGVQGVSLSGGSNTTGLGVGVGPGYAYFITPNVGLETLLKYNGIVGFGSQAYNSNLNLNVGFQIYLPGNKVKNIVNDNQ
jgi:hypothetical protein